MGESRITPVFPPMFAVYSRTFRHLGTDEIFITNLGALCTSGIPQASGD